MSGSEPQQVRLNSEQLRALAHPLRSRLLSALRAYGPATATALADRLGSNSGATSYHLRRLAAAGLIDEDHVGGTGGQRWWRSRHESTTWVESEFDADPDDRAAVDWAIGHHVRLMTRWVEDWVESRREWSTQWRDAAALSDLELRLTPEGLALLSRDLHEVIERHRKDSDSAEPGVERCAVILHAFPAPNLRL